MSVVNITAKLREAAGSHFTINQVKLGYREGGKKQVLSFHAACNKEGVSFESGIKVHELEGSDDPVKKAAEIGQRLAREIEPGNA